LTLAVGAAFTCIILSRSLRRYGFFIALFISKKGAALRLIPPER